MQSIVFFPLVVILWIHTFSHFSSLSTASSCTTDINLPLSGVISHLDQWIFSSLFWMYNIVDGLTPNSYSEHHYNSCVNEAGLTCIFSIRCSQPSCAWEHYPALQHYPWGSFEAMKSPTKSTHTHKRMRNWMGHEKNTCLQR